MLLRCFDRHYQIAGYSSNPWDLCWFRLANAGPNDWLKLIEAAILDSRGMNVLPAAPAADPYRLLFGFCTTMPFPLDIQFVKRAEAKLGRKLPLGYVATMCRSNGGEVTTVAGTWWLYPIFDDTDKNRLKRTCQDIVRETAAARDWPDFPPNALAIGDNGGGDVLVLLADGETDCYADAVYWWDHETGELNQLADAFEELR